MDSFYDVPRRAPAPTRVEKMNIRPAVPEVSLICPSISASKSSNCDTNDRLWPRRNMQLEITHANEYGSENTLKELQTNYSSGIALQSSLFRKQVRFESPVLQQRPSLTYEPFATRKMETTELSNSISVNNNHDSNIIIKQSNKPQKQTFQEIYMANIPNRHLDLSIIDIPKNSSEITTMACQTDDMQNNKENKLPKTYKEFLEIQQKISKDQKKNKTVIDILNYKRQSDGILNETPPSFWNSYSNNNEISTNQQNDSNKYTQRKDQNEKNNCQYLDPSVKYSVHSFNKDPKFLFDQDTNTTTYLQRRETMEEFHKSKEISRWKEMSQINKPYRKKDYNESNANCEPTNRDLLKIIAQQNEQLLLLQKQVALLLNRDHNCQNKPIEPAPKMTDDRNNVDKEPNRFIPEINLTPRKHGLSKFSVDVMTSFEVAIRPQHKQLPLNYNSSKIQEITEEESHISSSTDLHKKTKEPSLHFQEPMKVIEPCTSPVPSININMNDYDSSDDEVSASEIGATFYHNLMGQVNNILKQAQIQTTDDLCSKGLNVEKKITSSKANITMHRVREATLKHLKEIGVTIGPLEPCDNICSRPENDNREYSPTEISHGVKQLLMKYLPDEHLARISAKPKHQKCMDRDQKNEDIYDRKEAKPDFSIASLQYMKKYNLLPSDCQEKRERISERTNDENRKILDLTALKMQPKLL